jgi:predicted  nucleic acid-binding Zn-ribbon protein
MLESKHPKAYSPSMTDQPDNLMLVYLRRIDAKMDRVLDDIQDLKHRVTALEVGQSRIRQDIAELQGLYAGSQLRMDRIDSRLERIERRLDLQEAHP